MKSLRVSFLFVATASAASTSLLALDSHATRNPGINVSHLYTEKIALDDLKSDMAVGSEAV